MLRAVVFINRTIPINLGHVGYGFEISPGMFTYGAVEIAGSIFCPAGKPNAAFVLTGKQAQMLADMKTGQHTGGSGFTYQYYKYIGVRSTNVQAATTVANMTKSRGYFLAGNNCMNETYNVITAYACGNGNLLPWPLTHWFPICFYDAINTTNYRL